MSNRLLSLLVLTLVGAGLFGAYYYFFALKTGNMTLVINGSGSTAVTLTSEFGNSYTRDCEKNCFFEKIPAVHYTLSATRGGYTPFQKTFVLEAGEDKKMVVAMEKEVTLTEQMKKKEDTIATIKLKKDIQDTIEAETGSVVLGYRNNSLYYAILSDTKWDIFEKKEGADAIKLFQIRDGDLGADSLDVYEGYIALRSGKDTFFYLLKNGTETAFAFDKSILSIKNTLRDDMKIITSETGVYMYRTDDNTFSANPLYDDIIQLASGEIVALIKKTSTNKQSLLSFEDTSHDQVLLIGTDTRERKTLFTTSKNGKMLRYKDGKILFVDDEGTVFVVENVR